MKNQKFSSQIALSVLLLSSLTMAGCEADDGKPKSSGRVSDKTFEVKCLDNGKVYYQATISDLTYSVNSTQYATDSNGKYVVFLNGCIAFEK